MPSRNIQTAYEDARDAEQNGSLQERIQAAMYNYLTQDLGLPIQTARARAASEVQDQISCPVSDELEAAGVELRGKCILDLGAGLGGMSAELARRGARVIGIEPGTAWRNIAAERLKSVDMSSQIIGAVGEKMPIASSSIDVIVSLQVLEHVANPPAVIREAFRVLKPGGYFYATYENYFSFWEPHYRVRWLPLFPKPLGAIYLRALGRSPRFLFESINYTTFSGVRRNFLGTGFQCIRRRQLTETLRSPDTTGIKWRFFKMLGAAAPSLAVEAVAGLDYMRRVFRTGVTELMQKPISS